MNCQFRHASQRSSSCPSVIVPPLSSSSTLRPTPRVVGGPNSGVLATVLRMVFEKQQQCIFDPDKHALNLSSFRECADLRDITESIDFNSASFSDCLCRIIAEVVRPAPVLIVLDTNNIKSLLHFAKAMERHELHTALRGLSAAGNCIETTDFTQQLKGFVNLTELVLTGNPVTRRPEYKEKVRLYLPRLLGLDKESIQPVPLALPWPTFATSYSAAASELLELLNAHFFTRLTQEGGANAVAPLYAPKASFTVALQESNVTAVQPPQTQSSSRDAVRQTVLMRQRMIDGDSSILRVPANRGRVVSVGPAEIVSRMRSTLFPGTGEIAVVQKLHPAPSVIFLEGELIKEPVAVVTVHGLLEWSYPSHAKVEAQVRPFVRTLSLVPRQDSPLGWLIATDSLLLANPPKLPAGSVNAGVLCDTDSMVFDALGSSRVDRFARKCGVTTEMAGVAASFCRTDAQLTDVLTDLSYTSTSLLEQCHAVANGEPRAAMAVAWVSNKLSIPPAAAAQRLLEADKGDGDYFALAAAVIETALAHSS